MKVRRKIKSFFLFLRKIAFISLTVLLLQKAEYLKKNYNRFFLTYAATAATVSVRDIHACRIICLNINKIQIKITTKTVMIDYINISLNILLMSLVVERKPLFPTSTHS